MFISFFKNLNSQSNIKTELLSGMTVVYDLAIAVIIGVIVSKLVFAWKSATRIRARKSVLEDGSKLYEIWGPLFFGSTSVFQDKFTPHEDPNKVIVDFMESRIADHSGIETVQKLTKRYKKLGKKVRLRHLSPDCRRLLDNAEAMIISSALALQVFSDPSGTMLTTSSWQVMSK